MLGVVGAVVAWGAGEDSASMCASPSDRLDGVWDDTTRASLQDAFASVEVGYAQQTWHLVESRLDQWAEDWSAAHVETCESARRNEQPRAVYDAQMACLSRHLGALSAMLDAFSEPDANMLSTAVEAVDELPPAQRCSAAAVSAAASEFVDDPLTAAKAEEVRAELTRLQAIGRAGQRERLLEEIGVLAKTAEALGDHPAFGRVLLVMGDYRGRAGDFEPALEALERAVWIGLQSKDDQLVADAATEIIFLQSVRADPEGAEEWIRHADAALTRLGQQDTHDEYWNALGSLRHQAGDLDEAEAAFSRSLKIVEAEDGASSASAGQILGNLGTVYQARGEIDAAQKTYERALEMQEKGLGDSHPQVAVTLLNLATICYAKADYAKAERLNRRGIEVLEDARQFADAAKGRINLANAIDSQGRPAEARQEYERARATVEEAFGPEHPYVGIAVSAIGYTHFTEGNVDEAIAHYHKGLQILQSALGPRHRMLVTTTTNLGDAYARVGQHEKALAAFEQSVEILQTEPGMEVKKEDALVRVGATHVELDQLEQARAAFDQLEPELADPDPSRRGDHQILVARGLKAVGAPKEQIRTWAQHALQSYQEADDEEGGIAARRLLDAL
jgi:tetratricopeptide (TPR) repeat protein